MTKRFTGRHMAAILVTGFGVVVAVNFTMAALASSTFGGVVVQNSYVASQKFNGWLQQAEEAKALGWTAASRRRDDGRVLVETRGVPEGARVTGHARHPLGSLPDVTLRFSPLSTGEFVSDQALAEGRWTLRLEIEAGVDRWRGEEELP